MEQLIFVRPTKEHEEKAIEFINEFRQYKSELEGVNELQKYLTNYDEWLEKIEQEREPYVDDKHVPRETYFVIRLSDNKIVGMANLRFALNRRFSRFGGNIGACVRPTERKKGYSKIIAYTALQLFNEYEIDEILIDCNKSNIPSKSTILAMGGELIKEEYLSDLECTKQDYKIDVKKSLETLAPLYEEYTTRDETLIPKRIKL